MATIIQDKKPPPPVLYRSSPFKFREMLCPNRSICLKTNYLT